MSPRKAHTPPPEPPKEQTWDQRLDDTTKPALSALFIESMLLTARNNERSVDDLWTMWSSYVKTCEGFDQSPVFREFLSWNKLAGAGPLA